MKTFISTQRLHIHNNDIVNSQKDTITIQENLTDQKVLNIIATHTHTHKVYMQSTMRGGVN